VIGILTISSMRPPIVAALLFLSTGVLNATEKYWIIHEAKLIVVGTLRPNPAFPWFDGWHYTGTIDVSEVLFGAAPTTHLTFRYVDKSSMRDWRMFPFQVPDVLRAKAMWCLKPGDGQSWQPSAAFGFIDLSARQDYENHIPRGKR
jgi:hypothetical protein